MKIEDVIKLYEPFLKGMPLPSSEQNIKVGESYFFKVSYIPENSIILIDGKKYENEDGYFKVEYGFHFKATNFCMGHIFKLDKTQIEYELKKLGESGVISEIDIALIFSETYPNSHKLLACFNESGMDDYVEIAKLILNKRGFLESKRFGF